jgi:hypothetical protein
MQQTISQASTRRASETSGFRFPASRHIRTDIALACERHISAILDLLEDRVVEELAVEALFDFARRTCRPTWEHDLQLILSAQDAIERLYTELDAREDRSSAEPVFKGCEAAYDALEYLGGLAAGLDREDDWLSPSVPAHIRLRARRSRLHELNHGGDAR